MAACFGSSVQAASIRVFKGDRRFLGLCRKRPTVNDMFVVDFPRHYTSILENTGKG